jgi:BirA family biotin operon repressor/biotin-[acetyl-CoA-carboxylase] ligase
MQIEEVDQQWTSMRLQSGRCSIAIFLSPSWLQLRISRHRRADLLLFRKSGSKIIVAGRRLSLIAGVTHIDGVVLGIDSQGALRLKVDGVEKVFSGGELSLRLRDDS